MNESRPIQILELFGGIGSPRVALRNIGVPVKAIDYVEIDEKAVRSYNAMFKNDLEYKPQSVVGWNLKPDILIHGSPCQDVSIIGKRKGNDEGSGTRSSLMWETINIIKQMGVWKPKYVIWENVVGVLQKTMNKNFVKYLNEMEKMGYTNSYEILDARDFGLPHRRNRVFTISTLDGIPFDFKDLVRWDMKPIDDYIENINDEKYVIRSPSMLRLIEKPNPNNNFTGYLKDVHRLGFCECILTTQNRCPNSGIVKLDDGRYRLLTERECWRLQGYSEEDFENALAANPSKPNKMNGALYKQAGNSIPVPIFESIFKKIIFGETADHFEGQSTIYDFLGELK